jgi:acyl-CoA dehydrogenase
MQEQELQDEPLAEFRTHARAWLEANCPESMRTPVASEADLCWGGRHFQFSSPAQKLWMERMAAKGWTVPTWPKDYGGAGLSAKEAKVLSQELRRINARPPLSSFGIWMLGPALLKYGSEAQKLEHLPKIARGEIRWCQGYSEPEAGSDLAALKTKAEEAGDHFLVNGQKIWTSYANEADWIFCLVRTDPHAPKHAGISFLLFDMASPGVSTSPIKLISGYSPFCQTFFDNVRVPKANLVGSLNKGWDIAKYLLTHEREMIGGMDSAVNREPLGLFAARHLGLEAGLLSDPILRADITRTEMDSWAFMLTMERVRDEQKDLRARDAQKAGNAGALSSMLKYYGTELNKRRQELMMSVGGSTTLVWEEPVREGPMLKGEDDPKVGAQARAWLRSRANSIEGGTSEVQLNIIAKRILGLPSG